MPTIHIQADVSVDELLQAAEQLSETELNRFTSQVLALHAKRLAPNVTEGERELLERVNESPAETVQQRYAELITKRDAETLSKAEYAELLQLTSQMEAFDTARVEALSKLAALRGVTLADLTRQLDLDASPNG